MTCDFMCVGICVVSRHVLVYALLVTCHFMCVTNHVLAYDIFVACDTLCVCVKTLLKM